MFGEGWDLNTPLPYNQKAIMANARQTPQIGYFNDRFRDSVKEARLMYMKKVLSAEIFIKKRPCNL